MHAFKLEQGIEEGWVGGGVKIESGGSEVAWWLGGGGARGGLTCDECDGAERGDTSGAVNSHTRPFATEVREPHVWRGSELPPPPQLSNPPWALTLSTPPQ